MAVDQQIDGSQPSSTSRRVEKQGQRGTAGEATCRRRLTAARAAIGGGGWSVQQQGGGGVAGGELQRRRGSVAELLEVELRAPLRVAPR